MSETKKHREFIVPIFAPWSHHNGVPDVIIESVRTIEYSALVEEKQKVKELLSQLELAQGIIHSEFCGTEHHKICTHFEEIFKKYGDV